MPLHISQQQVQPRTTSPAARVLTHLERPEAFHASESGSHVPERRSSARFPLELPAELASGNVRLKAMTANISSGGTLLSCDQELEVGALVTVRVSWPIAPRSKQVILVVQGEIIRREASRIAIRHRRHEFEVHTQRQTASSPFSWQHHFASLLPAFAFLLRSAAPRTV